MLYYSFILFAYSLAWSQLTQHDTCLLSCISCSVVSEDLCFKSVLRILTILAVVLGMNMEHLRSCKIRTVRY